MEGSELGFGAGRLERLDLKCALCVVHKGAWWKEGSVVFVRGRWEGGDGV